MLGIETILKANQEIIIEGIYKEMDVRHELSELEFMIFYKNGEIILIINTEAGNRTGQAKTITERKIKTAV